MNIKIESGANVQITDKPIVNVFGDVVQHKEVNVCPEKNNTNTKDSKEKAAVLTGNADFMAIMQKAEEQGFCVKDGWQYKWIEKIDAVYFASVASHKFNLSRRHDSSGDLAISWKPFEALFNEKGFRSKYNDYQQGRIKLYHKKEIDNLLR